MPMVATVANGQPAFGLDMRSAEGDVVPVHLQVVSLAGDKVRHVGAFFDPRVFPAFGLPERLPADVRPDAGPFRSGPGADSVPQTG